jgi:two-component system CitB family response regulator
MVVEDDPMVQRINEEFLMKLKTFDLVGSFSTLEEARDYLERFPADLILLDVFFPQGHGTDLLKWIRKEEIDADVILITADKRSLTVAEARRYGVMDYLVKPFMFERFEESLMAYAESFYSFRTQQDFDQEGIDDFLGKSPDSSSGGGRNLTLEIIHEYLKARPREGFTALSIADALGISRITARRYLEELEGEGKVKMTLSYGGVGRPKNIYSIN